MPNGMTQEQMVDRMYAELVGLDGESGLVKDVKNDHEKIEYLEDNTIKKTECSEIRKGAGDRKDKLLMRLKDLGLLAAAIAGFLWGSGILSRGGK